MVKCVRVMHCAEVLNAVETHGRWVLFYWWLCARLLVHLYGDVMVSTGLLNPDKRVVDARWPLKKRARQVIADNHYSLAAA